MDFRFSSSIDTTMTPWPVRAVMNNPPDGFFDENITEELSEVAHHIVGSSSDSEEEVPANNDYELLPQESDHELELDAIPVTHGDQDVDGTLEAVILPSAAPVVLNENTIDDSNCTLRDELHEVWRGSCKPNDQPMDPEHAEKVKAAMANFTLPSSAVPAWAKLVPEEKWKAELVASLKVHIGDVTSSYAGLCSEGPSQMGSFVSVGCNTTL